MVEEGRRKGKRRRKRRREGAAAGACREARPRSWGDDPPPGAALRLPRYRHAFDVGKRRREQVVVGLEMVVVGV